MYSACIISKKWDNHKKLKKMKKKTHSLELVTCGINEEESYIFAELKNHKPGIGIPDIQKIREVSDVINTIPIKAHEKIAFGTLEVAPQQAGIACIKIPFETKVLTYEELPFAQTGYNFGIEELKEKLSNVENYIEAAVIGAEYISTHEIAALKITYFKKSGQEGVVKIINHKIYKKILPTNTTLVERVVPPDCLLIKR